MNSGLEKKFHKKYKTEISNQKYKNELQSPRSIDKIL